MNPPFGKPGLASKAAGALASGESAAAGGAERCSGPSGGPRHPVFRGPRVPPGLSRRARDKVEDIPTRLGGEQPFSGLFCRP